jgi:hypothetical protein
MKTVIYLFNGCGWGDHFLALPFINRQIQSNGPENVMVITYKNHIDNLFNNLHCHFIGIANSSFCFENIKNLILNFGPKKIISFNAFHPFDFDFHAKRFYKEADFYGKFDELGTSIRQPFKNYAHIRDQYFLLSQEKIQYKKKIEGLNLLKKNINFSKLISIKKLEKSTLKILLFCI